MTRVSLFVAVLAATLSAPSSRADVEVAPPPREVQPDGTRTKAPPAETVAPAENPVETVDRIIKNSKAVGDRLARTDTSTGTRSTQDKILKDIDSLINRQENPPPKSGGGSDNKNDMNQDKSQDQSKNDMNPSGGMSDTQNQSNPKNGMPPPRGGMNDGMSQGGNTQPKGGTPSNDSGMDSKGGSGNQQAHGGGRRPRMGQGNKGQQPKDKDPGADQGMANNAGSQPKQKPVPGDGNAKASKAPNGGMEAGGGMGPTAKSAAKPSLPLDDEVVKDVWGHLPDTLRKQVTQYYKEQFMPKYSDLLKQYYSSLASTPQKGTPEMRK